MSMKLTVMGDWKMAKHKLDIEFITGRDERLLAIVKNFPGLDAEMSEQNLRSMAAQLILAADKLAANNK